mgnify:FL=1
MSANCQWYAVTDCRADLIASQALGLKTFCTDAHRLTILDNSPKDQRDLSRDIEREADRANARYIRIPWDAQNRATANETHASALEWAWKHVILADRPVYAVWADMDLFLCAPFSVDAWMRGAAIRGWPQDRAQGAIRYVWPGLCAMYLDALPAPGQISWWCGTVDGERVDVGGQLAVYLRAHPEVVVKACRCAPRITRAEGFAHLPEGARASYDDAYRVDVFEGAFLHHVACTGWDHPDPGMLARKGAWVREVVAKCASGEWRMP